MSLRTSAARYARALLDVALKESDAARIERQLAAFVETTRTHEELGRALASPRVPAASRRQLVDALTKRMELEPPLAKLLVMLADRGRMELLPDLLDVYRERLLAHSNIMKGAVTSAIELSPDKAQALARSLSTAAGKTVQLETNVDASLVGGVVARLGSTVYDGSIRTQLERMKQQLVQKA
ncbi:MAG TPA: ATP synthase F1 subunit delta [Vicinamibacterales bacterium]|nr:ATP synthase F1 subunit delta [Vicinamibacterales bacterium]